MRSGRIASLLLAIGTTAAPAIAAADVTIPFAGDVTSVSGSFATSFDEVERVEGTLVFDETVADNKPDPTAGNYLGALVSLSATLPDLGFTWSAGAGGTLQVYDLTDQLTATALTDATTGPPIEGYGPHGMFLILAGPGAFAGDALPDSGAGLDQGELLLTFHDDFENTAGSATIRFTLPEPRGGGLTVAVWTVFALGARRRMRRRAGW